MRPYQEAYNIIIHEMEQEAMAISRKNIGESNKSYLPRPQPENHLANAFSTQEGATMVNSIINRMFVSADPIVARYIDNAGISAEYNWELQGYKPGESHRFEIMDLTNNQTNSIEAPIKVKFKTCRSI
jgi:phosphoribosylformylglycinamidine (FGAM) synthase-like amidotransferase family enzyme